ncbi:RING finger protein narya [Drosophila takahashii]|uniref:RING finger protein narya n=1 Tax=Drosophila takahashii TaxID=29030 RepID=UPI001CF8D95C|nr:RING finger protein narya [Drosophila takahashii]
MFRVHCNQCQRHQEVDPIVPFHFTTCQHVFCAPCVTKSPPEAKCPVCGRVLQSIAINRDMPIGVANYFEDPARFLQIFRKVSKFQAAQRASDNLGFYHRLQQFENDKRQLEGYGKMEAHINAKIAAEKKRIGQLRLYLEQHEQEAQKRQRRTSMGLGHRSPADPQLLAFNAAAAASSTSASSTMDEATMQSFFLNSDLGSSSPANPSRQSRKRSHRGDHKDFHL